MPDDGRQRGETATGRPVNDGADGAALPTRRSGRLGRTVRNVVLIGIMLAAIVGAGRWGYWQWSHVSETDARIVADMIVVSSRVSGWVVARPVDEGAAVAKGAVLVAIDARDAKLQIDEVDARIAGFAAERERLAAERTMLEGSTLSATLPRPITTVSVRCRPVSSRSSASTRRAAPSAVPPSGS